MPKVTLEDLSLLREFKVCLSNPERSSHTQVQVLAQHLQVREGVLEFFRVVHNNTCVVACFASGSWCNVECEAPTHEALEILDAMALQAATERTTDTDPRAWVAGLSPLKN